MVKHERKQRQRTNACAIHISEIGDVEDSWDFQPPRFTLPDKCPSESPRSSTSSLVFEEPIGFITPFGQGFHGVFQ